MEQRCLFCGGDPSAPGHWHRCDGRQGAREADDLYPPSNWTDTSRAAAASVVEDTATIRADIYHYMDRLGSVGATCDDIEQRLELRHQTASARLNELHYKLHVITDSGRRRRTRTGRQAVVYVVVRP
jgi:hypothetical protein